MQKIDSLKSLILEARQKSNSFNQKYQTWVVRRNKAPSVDWQFRQLVSALGEERIRQHLSGLEQE